MRPDPLGLYHLDAAHLHLLPSFVAQGWHAPRLWLRISELEVDPHVRLLNSIAILDLAHNEHVALKIEDGQLQARHAVASLVCGLICGAPVLYCARNWCAKMATQGLTNRYWAGFATNLTARAASRLPAAALTFCSGDRFPVDIDTGLNRRSPLRTVRDPGFGVCSWWLVVSQTQYSHLG